MKLQKFAWAAGVFCALASTSAFAQTPAKKELIAKLMVLQQPAIDATARNIAEQQPMQLAASAQKVIMQNVPEDKRQATAQAVDAEIKKYMSTAGPAIQASATKLALSSMTPVLDEKFTEEELRNLVGILDSPVLKKFQGMLPELTNNLLDKIIADARPTVDPSLNQLASNVRQILTNAAGTPPATKAPAAKPAKK